MSQPIPLRTTLSIKFHHIIINRPSFLLQFTKYFMPKILSPKARVCRYIQRQIQAHADACFYLGRSCGSDDGGREHVQRAELVGGAVEAPRVSVGAGGVEGEG